MQALDVHAQLSETRLGPGEALISACSHGHADTVRQVLQRHGGRLVAVRE